MKNRYSLQLAAFLVIFSSGITFAQNISTYAGIGIGGYSGDGGQATAAELKGPCGVWVDASNNLYICDESNYVLRKVNSSGVITTIAGIHVNGFSGDGGQATAAELTDDQGVCTDKNGNIFIADFGNQRVRIINTSGIITTIAGNGFGGYSGDGGPATAAELNAPSGVVADSNGNVYIADESFSHVRMVNTSGIINNFAGNNIRGFSGDGGPAIAAELNNITNVAIDAAQNIYIADIDNYVIRMVNTSGIISTFAGIGTVSGYSGDGGQATAAELNRPTGVCVDPFGNVYIGDQEHIRMVNTSGIISTVAGNGVSGYFGDGGLATAAEFNYAFQVATDPLGNFYFGDVVNARVRMITVPTTTGIASQVLTNTDVTLYPNPNNGKFTVQLSGINGKSTIEVYNELGERVLKTSLTSSSIQLDLSNNTKGVYFYKVLSETGKLVGSGRFIIE